MSMQQFDDQPEHARRLPRNTQGGDGVADPSHLITVRVEDAFARKVGYEHPRHSTHVCEG